MKNPISDKEMKRVIKTITICLTAIITTTGLCYAVEPNEQLRQESAEALDRTFMKYNQLLMQINHKQQKVDILKAQLWKTIGDIKTYNEVQYDLREDMMPDAKNLSEYASARRDYDFAIKELDGYKKELVQVEAAFDVHQNEYVRLSSASK